MQWREMAGRLKQVLGLGFEPVGIRYAEAPPSQGRSGTEQSQRGAEQGLSGAEQERFSAKERQSAAEQGEAGAAHGQAGTEQGETSAERGLSGAEHEQAGAEQGKRGAQRGQSGRDHGQAGSEQGQTGAVGRQPGAGQAQPGGADQGMPLSACGALLQAASGRPAWLCAASSACPGGSRYLGLEEISPEKWSALAEFLVRGEKLFCSYAAAARIMATAPVQPQPAPAPYIVFEPLSAAEAEPDIVVIMCNAWQAARLVNLLTYATGAHMACAPSGSLCYSAITYPMLSGRANVTMGDVTARRMAGVPEDALFFSCTYADLRLIAESLNRSSAGTAPVEMTPQLARMLKRRRS